MGDPDTNNAAISPDIANRDLSMRKAFDAIRATLDYDPLTIDAFYSLINETTAWDSENKDDIDLYGVSANYQMDDDWGTLVEGYFIYERDETSEETGIAHDGKTGKIYCPGVRIATNPYEGLNLQAEYAWQFGNIAMNDGTNVTARRREARAMQLMGTYALPFEKLQEYSPVVSLIYSWYSGDKNPADATITGPTATYGAGTYTAWDPLYENQTGGHIINGLFNATNSHTIDARLTCNPIEDVTLVFDYVATWADKNGNVGRWGTSGVDILTLINPSGNNNTSVIVTGDEFYGFEMDLELTYDYTEDVEFGLLYGWFNPRAAFSKQNRSSPMSIVSSCKVEF